MESFRLHNCILYVYSVSNTLSYYFIEYSLQNRGIYMFRLDEERVVDATLCGGLARYINHSCNPNCVAEIVEVERDLRIIIFAKRRISRGEEVSNYARSLKQKNLPYCGIDLVHHDHLITRILIRV